MADQARARAAWTLLRLHVAGRAAVLSAPRPGAAAGCDRCFGPAATGWRRCYPCELHEQSAAGSLADVVVPVAYAPKRGPLAGLLWRYKSAGAADTAAAAFLLRLLLVFLREHGRCVCQAAGMAPPTHVAVVPSGRGRPGPHPLGELVAPYLRLPWLRLAARPSGAWPARDLDPGRFAAAPAPGARVLLLDDTWTTGASAQSAAVALRQGGAAAVAVVVLGRHLGEAAGRPPGGPPQPLLTPAAAMPFDVDRCAVHDAAAAAS